MNVKQTLILHICCAPDATIAIRRLQDLFHLTGFFPNSNIHPPKEYDRRKADAKRICDQFTIDWVESEYDPESWVQMVHGLESEPEGGARCRACIHHNLLQTVLAAKNQSIPYFSTSLPTSPRKDLLMIQELGETLANEHGVHFVFEPFRKKNGYLESIQMSKEFQLYRQDYCGCVYSREAKS